MLKNNKKQRKALDHWDYSKMLSTKADRVAWLKSEAEYIRGMIHRSTRMPLRSKPRILQIGAGPCDVIDYWPGGERHAIDPLAEEYKEKFSEFQDPAVKYIVGVGENLPYEDNYFDVVIIRNGLDHVNDPSQTLREVFRVLKPSGALYMWNYLYGKYGSWTYRLINAVTKRFVEEPWAFTLGRIKKTLAVNGFVPCLPAVEERPVYLPENPSTSYWLKRVTRIVLGFWELKGFTCVALPLKGVHKAWRLPY